MRTFLIACLLAGLTACSSPDESPSADAERPVPTATDSQPPPRPMQPDQPADRQRILVIGNSIADGYGLDRSQSFPALLQQKIDSAGLPFVVDNQGVSGQTTAGGLNGLTWHLERPVDVLLLELGANDGLRGQPVDNIRRNLTAIIERVRQSNDDASVVLTGMQMPPSYGARYTQDYREVFPLVAREQDAALVPFLLDGVGGVPRLNQPDGVHPTAEGQKIVAQNVWRTLEPVLRARVAS
jgi:acyl-CoA thioesterase-1